jgi:hypothetical protein
MTIVQTYADLEDRFSEPFHFGTWLARYTQTRVVRPKSTALSHGSPLSLDRKNLYYLFICPYEELNLKPSPSTSTETYQLWDWDCRRGVYWFRLPEHPEIPGVRNVSARGVGRSGYRVGEAASRRWLDLELRFVVAARIVSLIVGC